MRVRIIGCTGSMSGPKSPASCYVLEATGPATDGGKRTWRIALDLGPGSFGALWREFDPAKLDAVLLTHLHADHCSDVISLFVHRRWHPTGNLGPLLLGGPPGVIDRVRQLDDAPADETFADVFAEYAFAAGVPLEIGPFTVTPFPARHTVPAFGLRVSGPSEDGGTATVAYTGDTDTCDAIVEMATDVDLLLCEAGFTETCCSERGIHLTGKRAAEIAQAAQPKRMVLTHIQPWTDPQVPLAEAQATWAGDSVVAVAGTHWDI